MNILLTEDDRPLREALGAFLRSSGHRVIEAADCASALQAVDGSVDLLLSDLRLPDGTGLDLIAKARALQPMLNILMMTGFGTIPTAVEAVKRGARGYLTKPIDEEELERHLRDIDDIQALRRGAGSVGRGNLVGTSAAMRRVYEAIDQAAVSDAPVLLTGETGSGKELAAIAIHKGSSRREGPFIAVNMGAIPADLAESELFGHEKGAFTGAQARRDGRIVLADGGTLLLDELDSLPLPLQAKLLRVLENSEVWPVGAVKPLRPNFRVLAATNASPEALRDGGLLRKDLYFRLGVLRIHLPPLREHLEDLPLIARKILDDLVRASGAPGSPGGEQVEITGGALAVLIGRPWPGNVRELRNVLESALSRVAARGDVPRIIDEPLLDPVPASSPNLPFKEARAKVADDWAKSAVLSALEMSQGNVAAAARELQMNTTALFGLIKKYGIKVDRGA